MEQIVCPECRKTGKVELNILSKKLRCPCGEEFVPLCYVPTNDFPSATRAFNILVLRGMRYIAVGYEFRSRGFVVVRGSRFFKNAARLSASAAKLRDSLIAQKTLRFWPKENCYIAERDVQIDSADLALSVISGGSTADFEWEMLSRQRCSEWEIPSSPDSSMREKLSSQYRKETHGYRAASSKKFVEPSPRQDTPESIGPVENGPRPDFLTLDSKQIRSLIVTVLERRPNNSVKRDNLAKEVLNEIDVRTSGSPRSIFEKKLLGQVHWLSDRNVVEEYKSKNRRIKLSNEYRDLISDPKRSSTVSKIPAAGNKVNANNAVVDPYTVKALYEQNVRLRKIVALLSQELGLNVVLGD